MPPSPHRCCPIGTWAAPWLHPRLHARWRPWRARPPCAPGATLVAPRRAPGAWSALGTDRGGAAGSDARHRRRHPLQRLPRRHARGCGRRRADGRLRVVSCLCVARWARGSHTCGAAARPGGRAYPELGGRLGSLSAYELQRDQNIEQNQGVLRELGLGNNSPEKKKPPRKPRVPMTQPQRPHSRRLTQGSSVDYAEPPDSARPKKSAARRPASSQKTPAPAASGGEPSTVETVQVHRGLKHSRPEPTAFSFHDVIIPPAVRAGGFFTCACDGHEVSINVPLGFAPGMRLRFAMPCASDPGAPHAAEHASKAQASGGHLPSPHVRRDELAPLGAPPAPAHSTASRAAWAAAC